MKRKLFRLSGLLVMVACIATLGIGCGGKSGSQKETTINISGSTSVQPISEVLAETFMAKNPGIKVFVQGGGSSAGIKAAKEGAADIGSSSRELKSEEKGLLETLIAKDGIAVVVHPANRVQNLTLVQIKGIYAGTITNWKDVGGEDQSIDVVTREEGSGTRGAFEELVMGKDSKIRTSAIVQGSTGAIRTTVAGNSKAIGYISLASLNESVKAVIVEGVPATTGNILNGTYQICRSFLYLSQAEPVGEIKNFIDFVLSPEGQALIEKEGLVRVK